MIERGLVEAVGRGRTALAGSGTRRESVRGGSVAASMPPHGPGTGQGSAPVELVACGRNGVQR
ncbi:hypothetical protein XdyCFBP7245_11740 [Xanthomonas dyei]|uniref:Uncharacterized protein n=1 Tax=Xanthomonas dyei TaxID=743699 RepID=A0A2S7C2S9_9XANT|nr:hypothetical protein XdyCFBP7245_11740 [Xanthomonas dyei]